MALPDYDKANATHAALLALLLAEAGGSNNPGVVARITTLCDAAADAVNDVESRVAIRGVKSLAVLLYSDDGHRDITAGGLRGAEAVRFRMMNALSTFRGRVEALEHRPPSRPEVPAIAPKKALRVLIVEDDRDSAESLGKLLEISGHTVTVAYTAMDGLEAAKRMRPDVVVCDIGLPDSDGFVLAQALRDNPITASVRLVAVTAYGRDQDLARSKGVGFELHLIKPANPAILLLFLEETPNTAADSADGRVVDIAAHKKSSSHGE
jgi:CheY-like chemotaxis protein